MGGIRQLLLKIVYFVHASWEQRFPSERLICESRLDNSSRDGTQKCRITGQYRN